MPFQPLFDNVEADVLAAIVVFVLGILFQRMIHYLSDLAPSRQMLDFQGKDIYVVIPSPTFIIPGTRNTSTTKGIPLAAFGTIFAYQHISNLLTQAYPKLGDIPVYFADDFPQELQGKNLILIGFPKTNAVSRRIMERLQLPLIFDDHALVDVASKEVKYQADIVDDEVIKDYGSLIRVRNPLSDSEDTAVFIFAGCQTFGVKAAAEFLSVRNLTKIWNVSNRGLWGKLCTRFPVLVSKRHRRQNYQVIVSVDVAGHYTSPPQLAGPSNLLGDGNKVINTRSPSH